MHPIARLSGDSSPRRAYVWGLLIAHGVSVGVAGMFARAFADWTPSEALPRGLPGRPRKASR